MKNTTTNTSDIDEETKTRELFNDDDESNKEKLLINFDNSSISNNNNNNTNKSSSSCSITDEFINKPPYFETKSDRFVDIKLDDDDNDIPSLKHTTKSVVFGHHDNYMATDDEYDNNYNECVSLIPNLDRTKSVNLCAKHKRFENLVKNYFVLKEKTSKKKSRKTKMMMNGDGNNSNGRGLRGKKSLSVFNLMLVKFGCLNTN
jgi:uncharacterized Ntn-hydrolase superfamily protein